MSIALAAAAAFCFASAAVAFKRGIGTNSLSTALTVSLPVIIVTTGAFVLFDPPDAITAGSVGWFVVGGLAGDGLARASFIGAVDRLGPSTATPIQTASYPVIALVGGVVFLAESVTGWRVVGAALIVAGIWSVAGPQAPAGHESAAGARHHWRWAYLLPVLAGVSFGVADVVRKVGLEDTPHAAFGATVGGATAALTWGVVIGSVPRIRRSLTLGPGWGWFAFAGVFVGFGLLAAFAAIEADDVSVVGPIILSQPLFVVMLSALFLREHEVLTFRLMVGAALTVAGVVSLTVGR